MTAASSRPAGVTGRWANLASTYERIELLEAEVMPVAVTLEMGDFRCSLPLGAFTRREGQTRFVGTVDIVGLTAAILGIRVGDRAVRALTPVIEALAERLRSRR